MKLIPYWIFVCKVDFQQLLNWSMRRRYWSLYQRDRKIIWRRFFFFDSTLYRLSNEVQLDLCLKLFSGRALTWHIGKSTKLPREAINFGVSSKYQIEKRSACFKFWDAYFFFWRWIRSEFSLYERKIFCGVQVSMGPYIPLVNIKKFQMKKKDELQFDRV